MTNAILITNLSKSYGETVVFRNFSARLPLGETTVITGVSGGGKTTLLRLILGLETPDGGEIAGVPRPRLRQQTAAAMRSRAAPRYFRRIGSARSSRRSKTFCSPPDGKRSARRAIYWRGSALARVSPFPPRSSPAGCGGGARSRALSARSLICLCSMSRSRGWTRQTAAPPWTRCAPSPMTKPFYLSPTTPPKLNFSAETGFLSLDSAPFPR